MTDNNNLDPSVSNPLNSKAPIKTTLTKRDMFDILPNYFTATSVSSRLLPDDLYDFFDFGNHCPTIDEVIHHNCLVHPFNVPRVGQTDVRFDVNTPFRTYVGQANVFSRMVEIPVERPLVSIEIQNRLNLYSTIQANNPVNLATNTYRTRSARLAALFQHGLPDTNVTTYNHQMLLGASLCDFNFAAPPGNRPLCWIGLDAYLQLNTQNPAVLNAYYPILWDRYTAGDANDFQFYLEALARTNGGINAGNITLCLVCTDGDVIGQAGAGGLPNAIPAPGIPIAANPGEAFIRRILKFMNKFDRQIFLFTGIFDASGAWLYARYPQYEFANHALEFAAHNWSIDSQLECLIGEFDLDICNYYRHFILGCIWRRVCDYWCLSFSIDYLSDPEAWRILSWNYDDTGVRTLPVPNPQLRFYSTGAAMPFELLPYVTGIPLLMQRYEYNDFKNTLSNSTIQTLKFDFPDGRPRYIPSCTFSTNQFSPVVGQPIPSYNQLFNLGLTFANVGFGVYSNAGIHINFFPVGDHISHVMTGGLQDLYSKDYFKIDNFVAAAGQSSWIALVRDQGAPTSDVSLFKKAGISFPM